MVRFTGKIAPRSRRYSTSAQGRLYLGGNSRYPNGYGLQLPLVMPEAHFGKRGWGTRGMALLYRGGSMLPAAVGGANSAKFLREIKKRLPGLHN